MTTPSPTTSRLAQQARRLVSAPSEATLEIDGERQRHSGACSVGLAEHGGVPAFFCSPTSALVEAADHGRPAILVLRSDTEQSPIFARLIGVLVRDGYEDVDGVEVVRVNLDPARVSLHQDERDVVGTEVPLEAYLGADFTHPHLDVVASQILEHANGSHGADLRASVARAECISRDDIIAAEVTHLDATGAVISWLDERGAHRTFVNFATDVECPHALADSLREALDRL